MKSIRRGVFETNSSSTHSISIVAKEDYDKWNNGEALFDDYKNKIVLNEDVENYKMENKYSNLITSEEYFEDEYLESFEKTFTTKSGETVIAFGKYGWDG